MLTPSGVDVQSVAFGQGGVEVSYTQPYETDQATGIQEIKSLLVPIHVIPDAIDEVLDSIDQMIKAIHVERRQPPPTRQR